MCQVTLRIGGLLMYSKILNVKYSEIRERFVKFDAVDIGKRIITLSNLEYLDTVSNDSDIVVYYNVMGDTTPIMLVERLDASTVQERKVKVLVGQFNSENGEYVATLRKVKKDKGMGSYLDVTVVRRRVYENLQNS